MIESTQKMDQLSSASDFLIKLFKLELFMTKTVHELVSGYDDALGALSKISAQGISKKEKFSLVNSV